MKSSSIVGIVALFSLSVAACGKSAPNSEPGVEKAPLSGTATQNVSDLQAGRYGDPCEVSYHKAQQEIAAALDAHAKEIAAVSPDSYESKTWKVVPMGKTFARERKTVPSPRAGWQTDESESWAVIYKEYLEIKDHSTPQDWAWLDMSVKSILSDDQDRVVYHSNYTLGKDEAPLLRQVALAVSKCLADLSCGTPMLSEDEGKFIRGNSFYADKMNAVDWARSLNTKRSAISELDRQLERDLASNNFRSNLSVRRESVNRLVVPLDGSAFGDALDQIAGYIESMWKKSELALKVQWTQPTQYPGEFRLFLNEGAGGRSFVSFDERTVHLYPYVRSRSIAHEIGHVLGFKDHYYTVWSPEKCGYVIQDTDEDIMSQPTTGSVTSEEWKELEDAYPAG